MTSPVLLMSVPLLLRLFVEYAVVDEELLLVLRTGLPGRTKPVLFVTGSLCDAHIGLRVPTLSTANAFPDVLIDLIMVIRLVVGLVFRMLGGKSMTVFGIGVACAISQFLVVVDEVYTLLLF